MIILYISNLSTNIAAGLNWSVPATVKAQAKFDDVLWINLTNVTMNHWTTIPYFHNIEEFGNLELKNLPEPFNHPDIVVFEGFYHIKDPLFARKLRKVGIPYIIVPRSALTLQAQRCNLLKRLKKIVANHLIFKPYSQKALAIQYLTKSESENSGNNWNKNSFIVPNGFILPDKCKESFSEHGLIAVFIGRLDYFQKGIDDLLKSCKLKQSFFDHYGLIIHIYGPRKYDYKKIEKYIQSEKLDNFVFLHDEITGHEKEKILLNSDLFLLPSRFEGHPMGLIEALSYGLPSLVSQGSNMLEEIKKYDAGWGCKTDSQSIAASLEYIITHRSELIHKSHNARKLGEKYNWDSIAKTFYENVKILLNKSPKS